MIKKILNWVKAKKQRNAYEQSYAWYQVSWDDTCIYRKVAQPGKEPWHDRFHWDQIVRVCFEATDYMTSDVVHFYISGRAESYAIPTEASGGGDLWNLVVEKDLFDAELAVLALGSIDGVVCWPRLENEAEKS